MSLGNGVIHLLRNLFLILILLSAGTVNKTGILAQTGYSYFYRIIFTDKGSYTPENFAAASLLSEKAISRRAGEGIDCPGYHDLPVFSDYIETVKEFGLELHSRSRWMNSALFKSVSPADTGPISDLPFVSSVTLVKKPPSKGLSSQKDLLSVSYEASAPYDHHIAMLNGLALHRSGYTGKGVLVAVLDAGFPGVQQISSLADLRARKGVKATYDFINNSPLVFNGSQHGTIILSVLAGNISGAIEGTAPGADFLLLKTEDNLSEFPVEEDYWVAAAEYADSAGADIITTSLGYSRFDDPSMNYTYNDMNGTGTFITRAADIAASLGIAVFSSAGNERNKEWVFITAPADGFNVTAVGAVDQYNTISSFSSSGPSADGRIKPDLSAMGVGVPGQNQYSVVEYYNGTSLSCPVVSGLAACLMQAVPDAGANKISNALRNSADRSLSPDNLYGKGLPDMLKALVALQEEYLTYPENETAAGPNPTSGTVNISLKNEVRFLDINIYSTTGTCLYSRRYEPYAGRAVSLEVFSGFPAGLYLMRLHTDYGTFVHRIIRIAD